jgi:hypothetical protein
MNDILWIVFKVSEVVEFQGVFENEKDAIDACRDERYCIGPVKLNVSLPDKCEVWPGSYFPKQL